MSYRPNRKERDKQVKHKSKTNTAAEFIQQRAKRTDFDFDKFEKQHCDCETCTHFGKCGAKHRQACQACMEVKISSHHEFRS